MEITHKELNGVDIFKIVGRLDSNTSPTFEEKLFEAIRAGSKNVLVDFETLDYISSAGLRVILKATKELKGSNGSILLCSMKDYIKEVFEIAGFDTFLPIYPTEHEALTHL